MIIILICILILLIVNFYYHNCEEYEDIDSDLKECINKVDAFKKKWNDDKIKKQKEELRALKLKNDAEEARQQQKEQF